MKKIRLNTLHRYAGIIIAPFIVLQAVSGLLLDFGLFRRGAAGPAFKGPGEPAGPWDRFLMKVHFGPGILGDTYHILLGAGIIWMAVSGWVLYLRLRRARKNLRAQQTEP